MFKKILENNKLYLKEQFPNLVISEENLELYLKEQFPNLVISEENLEIVLFEYLSQFNSKDDVYYSRLSEEEQLDVLLMPINKGSFEDNFKNFKQNT